MIREILVVRSSNSPIPPVTVGVSGEWGKTPAEAIAKYCKQVGRDESEFSLVAHEYYWLVLLDSRAAESPAER